MEDTKAIRKMGWRWFFLAGIVAIGVSIFLADVDYRLSTSTAEQTHAESLRELREAQAGLRSGELDPRLAEDDSEPQPEQH